MLATSAPRTLRRSIKSWDCIPFDRLCAQTSEHLRAELYNPGYKKNARPLSLLGHSLPLVYIKAKNLTSSIKSIAVASSCRFVASAESLVFLTFV